MTATRRVVQFGFLALTLVGVFVVRGDAERWCPFGGVEAIHRYATEGNLTCSLGVSNFYILGAVLLMTVLLRRVFCGYVCPVGTISEWMSAGARRLGIRPLRVPAWFDRGLSLLKYPALGVILYFTWRAGELLFRSCDPCYALISRHGKDITIWAYVVSGAILLASLLVVVPFCRWLCPLAAVLTPFSRFSPTRVTRDPGACTDCGLCSRACPMDIRVDRVQSVNAARCTMCLDCVSACPHQKKGALRWGWPRFTAGRWGQPLLVGIILLCVGGAVAATYAFPLPSFVQEQGTPPAQMATVDLRVDGVTCRGSSAGLVGWLTRDDGYGVSGYLKVETWPASKAARVRITFDPTQATEDNVKRAMVVPYFDLLEGVGEPSPYTIEGWAPSVDDL